MSTKEQLHSIEFLGDGNALFYFTDKTERLVPAREASDELIRLYAPATQPEPEWQWWWSNEMIDSAYHGPFPSRDMALINAQTECQRDTAWVFEGKRQKLLDDMFDADQVIADWHDHNMEVANEDGELSMDPTSQQKLGLEKAVEGGLTAWRQKHNLGRAHTLETRGEVSVSLNANRGDLPA